MSTTQTIDWSKYETPPQIDFSKYEGQQPSGVKAGGGKADSYFDLALRNSPSGADPHNPGNPNLNAVPESERQKVNDTDLGIQASVLASEGPAALFRPTAVTKAGPLVPAGRDAAGKFLPWIESQVSEVGPSLARQGISAATQFAKDHPVASVALGSALGKMGAGTAMHFLKKLGLLAAEAE